MILKKNWCTHVPTHMIQHRKTDCDLLVARLPPSRLLATLGEISLRAGFQAGRGAEAGAGPPRSVSLQSAAVISSAVSRPGSTQWECREWTGRLSAARLGVRRAQLLM